MTFMVSYAGDLGSIGHESIERLQWCCAIPMQPIAYDTAVLIGHTIPNKKARGSVIKA
jgi:hypothetical protein